jgi:hypothetical protein
MLKNTAIKACEIAVARRDSLQIFGRIKKMESGEPVSLTKRHNCKDIKKNHTSTGQNLCLSVCGRSSFQRTAGEQQI